MSNLKTLIAGIEKAKSENMTVVKDGSPQNDGFIVINGDHAYNVGLVDNKIATCTCPHFTLGKFTICKHMIKVAMEKDLDVAQLKDVSVAKE